MGKLSRRPGRADRMAPVVKINTDARNGAADWRYKGNAVLPGSGPRATPDPFALRESHSQVWRDDKGHPHPSRRAAVAHSKKNFLPRVERT